VANDREIRRRIKSVKNIAQVTKAMEAVSASKMRRAQAQALATRPYASKAWDMLTFLARLRASQVDLQPLLQERPERRILLMLITSDRGLAGGLNANMLREGMRAIHAWEDAGKEVGLVAVGRKGRDFMRRYGPRIEAEFINVGDKPTSGAMDVHHVGADEASVVPIARVVIDDFTSRSHDAVYIGYMEFINAVVQRPVIRKLLPIVPEEPPVATATDYIFEPNAQAILGVVLERFTEVQILQALYEAIASEHSARMVAMRNATDAANDLIADLTLSANKARQEKITKELMDIVGGSSALAQATAQA
jgi:F-type H+-transporting ATPase subunit gamma